MSTTLQAVTGEDLALRYLADLVSRVLLEAGAPLKASEVARLIPREDVDLKLVRVVLASDPSRFTVSDRKWTLWTRFSDPAYAIERNIEAVINSCGQPVALAALARELAAIYRRPAEVYEEILPRLLRNPERYFESKPGSFGLAAWLLSTDEPTVEDVMFDNFLNEFDVAPYLEASQSIDPSDVGSIVAFLDAVNEPVATKIVQLLVWQHDTRAFDARRFYRDLLADGRAVLLSGGMWLGPRAVEGLTAYFSTLAQREVEESGEAKAPEAATPLVISPEEHEQIVEAVLRNETTSRAAQILESVFEVSEGDPTYEVDFPTIVNALRSDSRVVWVGADRFLPAGAVPSYVLSVPEILRFNDTVYVDAEGNVVDVLLEEDGFDGGLEREIRHTLALDVLDEEPVPDDGKEPPVTARCVLKYHHKEIGTLPLCQLPPRFFPDDAPILQADLILPSGQKLDIWVSNENRLVYGLLDWYLTLPVDSGAVFYLERQSPDRYVLTYGEETEPAMFVSRNRVNELVELGQRAEAEGLPTFEILREIMEHYRKGIEFITVLTELNIARRTRRRLVASLLSGYHCFFQRGRSWVFDQKKLSQGFDKSKRKYLVK